MSDDLLKEMHRYELENIDTMMDALRGEHPKWVTPVSESDLDMSRGEEHSKGLVNAFESKGTGLLDMAVVYGREQELQRLRRDLLEIGMSHKRRMLGKLETAYRRSLMLNM